MQLKLLQYLLVLRNFTIFLSFFHLFKHLATITRFGYDANSFFDKDKENFYDYSKEKGDSNLILVKITYFLLFLCQQTNCFDGRSLVHPSREHVKRFNYCFCLIISISSAGIVFFDLYVPSIPLKYIYLVL